MIRKKLSAGVLLTALISPTLLADEPTVAANQVVEDDPADQLISCTMNLVQNRKGSERELQQLAYMTQAAITEEVNESSVEAYVQQCKNLEESLAAAPKTPKKEYLAWIEELSASKGTKKLLTGFVKPRHQCYTLGVHNGLGLFGYGILGANIGADVAACTGSLGHRWFEIRPYGELTTGLGTGYRWGFHKGEEDGSTPQPVRTPHLRASVDFNAYIGGHLNVAVSPGTEEANQFGLTFSKYPSIAFGGGGGANIPFGLKSGVYNHLKSVVLEPTLTSSL